MIPSTAASMKQQSFPPLAGNSDPGGGLSYQIPTDDEFSDHEEGGGEESAGPDIPPSDRHIRQDLVDGRE